MFRNNKNKQHTIIYRLMITNRSSKIKLTRLKTVKEHYNNLIKANEIMENKGFFKYESEGIFTHMFPEPIDLIFVKGDGSIIKMYKSFEINRITKRHENTKFVYILPQNTIKINNIIITDIITHQKWKRKI